MKKKWLIINYHIYEFQIIVYHMKLKWIILIDIMFKIM